MKYKKSLRLILEGLLSLTDRLFNRVKDRSESGLYNNDMLVSCPVRSAVPSRPLTLPKKAARINPASPEGGRSRYVRRPES